MRLLLSILLLAVTTLAHSADPRVELRTNRGVIVLELYPDKAPKTVANFLEYVKDGHYEGTTFHRVIDGFMIQGGGFDRDFRQKQTRAPIDIEAETSIKAGLKNDYGTIAMARTSNPNSATAQFFINVKNNDFLNFREASTQGYGYTVFGRVVSGMDVVEKVAKAPTGAGGPFPRDVPREAVVIEKATLLPEK